MEQLVVYLPEFARETRPSTQEWMLGLNSLVGIRKISSFPVQEGLRCLIKNSMAAWTKQIMKFIV